MGLKKGELVITGAFVKLREYTTGDEITARFDGESLPRFADSIVDCRDYRTTVIEGRTLSQGPPCRH